MSVSTNKNLLVKWLANEKPGKGQISRTESYQRKGVSSSSLNRVSEWGLMSWVEWIVMHNITNCVEFEIRHDSLKIFYTRSEKFNKRKAHARCQLMSKLA